MSARGGLWIIAVWGAWFAAASPVHSQELPAVRLLDRRSLFDDRSSTPDERSESQSEAGRDTELDEIETDRDSYTPATTTAGFGRTILESAYTLIDNRRTFDTHSFPETVLRMGVARRLELRLHWNYEVGGGTGGVTTGEGAADFEGFKFIRETQIVYGAKLGVTEQKGWIPESAVLLLGATPTSGEEPASGFIGTYIFGWKLLRDWKLDGAMRYLSDAEEGDGFNVWSPSVVLKYQFAERWNAHVEYFGQFSQHRENSFATNYFSPGMHYLITRDLEVGVRLGWGLNDQSARFLVNAGLGWRF